MCLDWGLRKLRPGQNKDRDHELDIRVEAQKLFNKHNPNLNPDNLSQTEEVYQEDYGPTHLAIGLLRRRQYIYSQYGGPRPEYQLEPRPPGRGHGRGRGRGRGRGGGGVDTAGSTLNTSSRGGARGCKRAAATQVVTPPPSKRRK